MADKEQIEELTRRLKESEELSAQLKLGLEDVTIKQEENTKQLEVTKTNQVNRVEKFPISLTKLRKYSKAENFARFCERFVEYVYINKLEDVNLYLVFLQYMDDEKYSILKTVQLTNAQKSNPSQFCAIYKDIIYGSDIICLKNEVLDCKQLEDESVSSFGYRLREKAIIAFSDTDSVDTHCLMALLRGVRKVEIKRKLNEKTFSTFDEALSHARRLEKVDELIQPHVILPSILKSPSVVPDDNLESERSRSKYREKSPARYNRYSPGPTARRSPSPYNTRNNSFSETNRSHSPGPSSSFNNQRSGNDFRSRNQDRTPRRNNLPRGADPEVQPGYRQGRQSVVCWFCNKSGHIKRNCWARKGHNTKYDNRSPSLN